MHELIILFGPEYAKTKHEEYSKIFNYTRQFKELHILRDTDSNDDTIKMAKRYIYLIKKVFSTEISQKLYENAKNRDVYGLKTDIPIQLSKQDEQILTNYYNEIEKLVKAFYEKAIRNTSEMALIKGFKKDYKEDISKLASIREGLTKAFEYYKNFSSKAKSKTKQNKIN